MNDLERRKFELHADTDDYHYRVVDVEDWIHRLFDRFDTPCVSYSGGKDSLVLLHLVAQRCGYDTVDVYHFDNGLLRVPGADDFVRASVERIGGTLHQRTSDAATSEAMVLKEGHGYDGYWGHYHELAATHDWDVRVLGIRAEESPQRRDRFDTEGVPMDRSEGDLAAAPIHSLTTRDVWAYIVENDIDYHEIYDKQGDLYDSMEAPENRLVTLYDSEFDSLGAREISQFIYPTETNELKEIEQSGG